MNDPHRTAVLNTYRSLRLAMLVIVVMLAVAVVTQRLGAQCWQTSISAYYFTSAHAVFIAALCAIGTCFIVYQGNTDTEDVVLNVSGFLAFVVAFVPTQREPVCGSGLPAAYEVGPGVRTAVLALIVAGVLAEGVRVLVTRNAAGQPPSVWARRATVAGWVVIGAGIVAYAAAPAGFEAHGHMVAAVAMFVGIIGVVLLNAASADTRPGRERYVRLYQGIAVAMTVLLAAVVVIRLAVGAWAHAVIWVEVVLIGVFAAFWVVQTIELWDVADRREVTPAEAETTGR